MKTILYIGAALLLLTQCREGPVKHQHDGENLIQATRTDSLRMETARSFAMETQAALGATLQKQIGEHGAADAIEFCNIKALPITDSVAASRGVSIRRVTDQIRNPANAASPQEAALMDQMRTTLAEGNPPTGRELQDTDSTRYYFPILTSDLCLQCHGNPDTDISGEVIARLRESYPSDQATGYGAGQLRGMWRITLTEPPKSPGQ